MLHLKSWKGGQDGYAIWYSKYSYNVRGNYE
nr:MAG TPA: hypothetical protein [Caudoviricetes sp.]